MHKATMLKPQ